MKKKEIKRKAGSIRAGVLIGMLILMAMITVLAGCRIFETPEHEMKRRMEEEYGEKFTVYSAYYSGKLLEGIVAPVNNPTLVFKQEIDTREGAVNPFCNCYRHTYGSRLVMQMLEDDIEQLFPDSYFYADFAFNPIDDTIDFRGQTIEEFMANSIWHEELGHGEKPVLYNPIIIYIVFSESDGTEEKYKKEYEFFSKQIDKYVEEGLMPHLRLILTKTSQNSVENLRKYMEKNDNSGFFRETVDGGSKLNVGFYNFEGEGYKCEYVTEEEYIKGRKLPV